jgi:predicted MFS family arabinose efflux permease
MSSPVKGLGVLCAVVVVLMGTVSVVNLSVPDLAAGPWRPSTAELTWIVDAYAVVFACLLLPSGVLGTRWGRRRTLLLGLALFVVGSVASALAPSVPALVAARALAGAGAALALPQSLALPLATTPAAARPHVIAVWTASTSIAGVVGNGLGGLALEVTSWRGVFLGAAALAVVLGLLVRWRVGALDRVPGLPVDVAGLLLFTTAVCCLLVVLVEGPPRGVSAVVLVPAAVGVLATVGFVGWQRRSAHPSLDVRAFRNAGLRCGVGGIVALFAALFALFFLNATYLRTVHGASPALAGAALVPVALVMFVVTRLGVRVVARRGTRQVVTGGFLLAATGFGVLALAAHTRSLVGWEFGVVVVAAGAGACSAPLSTLVLTVLPGDGAGAGLNSTVRELGAAVGVALAGVLLGTGHAGTLSVEAVTRAATDTFLLVGGLLAVTGTVCHVALRAAGSSCAAHGRTGGGAQEAASLRSRHPLPEGPP